MRLASHFGIHGLADCGLALVSAGLSQDKARGASTAGRAIGMTADTLAPSLNTNSRARIDRRMRELCVCNLSELAVARKYVGNQDAKAKVFDDLWRRRWGRPLATRDLNPWLNAYSDA